MGKWANNQQHHQDNGSVEKIIRCHLHICIGLDITTNVDAVITIVVLFYQNAKRCIDCGEIFWSIFNTYSILTSF